MVSNFPFQKTNKKRHWKNRIIAAASIEKFPPIYKNLRQLANRMLLILGII